MLDVVEHCGPVVTGSSDPVEPEGRSERGETVATQLMAKYIWSWSVGAAYRRPSDVDLRNKPGTDHTSMIGSRHPCW